MSLKIIGVGFGRTGTLSTQYALNELGYSCYHMMEVVKKTNKNHLDFWIKVADSSEGTQHNWDEVFNNYNATLDYPACCVWQELVEAYPEAKVILTLHPKGPESWYESTRDTIYAFSQMWENKVLAYIIPSVRKALKMTSNLVWGRFLKGTLDNKKDAINRYNEHIEEIKSQIPADRLLIFSVDQGWKPLCTFLNKEVPGSKFPNTNDKVEMKKRMKFMSLITKILIALISTIGIVIIWMIV